MTKLVNDYMETTLEDDNGAECDIRVFYEYQPSENAEYEEGRVVYPGCESFVTINGVERNEPFYDVDDWNEFYDYDEKQEAAWSEEIHDLINKRAREASET